MPPLFFTYLFFSAVVSSLLILLLVVTKKIFTNHLSVRWHYNLWFLLIVVLLMPFAPKNMYRAMNEIKFEIPSIKTYFQTNHWKTPSDTIKQAFTSKDDKQDWGLDWDWDWMQDFSLSVNRVENKITYTLISLWGIGISIFLVSTFVVNRKTSFLLKEARMIKDTSLLSLYEQCKKDLQLKNSPALIESSFIKTPMLIGFFKTTILLPMDIANEVAINDIRHMLLHELCHYKNKDIFVNYLICFLQIIYWFNPLVWYGFQQMRIDREIACDIAVLKTMDEKNYKNYGLTLINFLDKISNPSTLAFSSSMSGSSLQIKKRIRKIATFKGETKITTLKSILIFLLVGMVVFSNAGLLSSLQASNLYYDTEKLNIAYEDDSSYFGNYKGSFVLYDLQNNQYQIYNKTKSTERISPDSTYKIVSALIGLHCGVLKDKNTTLKWDGTKYPFDSWNKDNTLLSAMKSSTNWYFQKVDSQVGEENLKKYYGDLQYGNQDLSAGIHDYWLESSLKISPVEQVGLLKNIYSYETVFSKAEVDVVKNILKISENNGAVLSGKTGTGTENGKNKNGWFIGYVEKNNHTFFFATNIQNQDDATGKKATEITLSILKDKKIY